MLIHTISAYETSAEDFFGRLADWRVDMPVSYTHLTLPTICSV